MRLLDTVNDDPVDHPVVNCESQKAAILAHFYVGEICMSIQVCDIKILPQNALLLISTSLSQIGAAFFFLPTFSLFNHSSFQVLILTLGLYSK